MPDRKLCFVIGPIGEAKTPERKLADYLLKGLFKPVLEAEELGYRVKRADEDADPGSITAAMITDLINADLVVADLTGFNPNAFYELGIRHASFKPTIHVMAEQVKLPFDNKDQRTIFVDIGDFDSLAEAKERLRNAALAIEQPGYQVSNPVTQAQVAIELRSSGDPTDQALLDLQERLDRLEGSGIAEAITGQGPLATMSIEDAAKAISKQIASAIPTNPVFVRRTGGLATRDVTTTGAKKLVFTPKKPPEKKG